MTKERGENEKREYVRRVMKKVKGGGERNKGNNEQK